jgi:hypothetical protein
MIEPYICIAISLVLISCGIAPNEEHVKDFKFYITNENLSSEVNSELRKVFSQLNTKTGMNRFQVVDSKEKANSFINIVDVSRTFGGNSIGAGGPIYSINQKTGPFDIYIPHTKTMVYHGMDIDIDRKWWVKNMRRRSDYYRQTYTFGRQHINYDHFQQVFDGSSHNAYENNSHYNKIFEILVLHEIGHGLGFAHSQDKANVMFKTIGTGKNLEQFYNQVRKSLTSNHY